MKVLSTKKLNRIVRYTYICLLATFRNLISLEQKDIFIFYEKYYLRKNIRTILIIKKH